MNTTNHTSPSGEELKLCPFCGSANISEGEVLMSNPDGGASTQSMCRDCGALGPDAHLREGEIDFGSVKATAAWNRRASLTAEKVAQAEPVAWLTRWPNGTCEIDMDKDRAFAEAAIYRTKPVPLYAAPPAQTPVALTDDARDAVRYRWLRDWQADSADFCCASLEICLPVPARNEKEAPRKHSGCFDAAIDAAMTAAQPAQTCESCDGEGLIGSHACPDCQLANAAESAEPIAWMVISDWTCRPLFTTDKSVALGWKAGKREVVQLCAIPQPAQSRDVLTDSTLDEVCRLATHCGLAEFRARARILLTAPQPAQSDAVAREISGLDPLEWGGDGGPHEQRLLSQRGVEQSAVVLDDERAPVIGLLKRARYVRHEDLPADVRDETETRAAYGNSAAWQDARNHEQRRLIDEALSRLEVLATSPQSGQTEQALKAQLNAAYAALDAVADWAKQEGADDDMEAGTRLLALLLKHGVHPRETLAVQPASGGAQ